MRKLASIVVCAGLLVSISACSTPVSSFAACDDTGNASLVTADGEFGADPDAEFPTPLISKETGVAHAIVGDGEPVIRGGIVSGTISIYMGETGEALVNGGPINALPILLPTRDFLFPFTDVLQCGEVGGRIVTTGIADNLLGASSITSLGVEPEATLVVVTDITATFLGRADGADQLAQSGMPAIVLAPGGQPGFTFPESVPTTFRSDLLKKGSGTETAADDRVLVQYSAIEWGGETTLESTWSGNNGTPVAFVLDGTDTDGSVISGAVKDALIGVPVGSQILVVSPGETTVVFVIDVLGIAE